MSKEAMKLALEALTEDTTPRQLGKAIVALSEALALPDAPKTKVLMEHSGCGHGTQVDQITVHLNPGDKVVLVMGRYSAAIAQAAQS